jgi:YVTN family beta-propeller protein
MRKLFATLVLAWLITPAHAQQQNPLAFVSAIFDDNVHVINTTTDTVVTAFTEPGLNEPFGTAVSPDGTRVYFTAQQGANSRFVADATQQNLGALIAVIPVGDTPSGVAVSPNNKTIYVNNGAHDVADGSISVIDAATLSVVATIPDVGHPLGVAVTPNNRKVYVSNYETANVDVIDAASNTIVTSIAMPDAAPYGVVAHPNGRVVYVVDQVGNAVILIDTATDTAGTPIPIGPAASGIAISPRGDKLYVAAGISPFQARVDVVDTASATMTNEIVIAPETESPVGIAVTSDGAKVYVCGSVVSNCAVIDTASNSVIAHVDVGAGPVSFGIFIQPKLPSPVFAGTPGSPDCHGKSVSALSQKDGSLAAAATALGFASVSALIPSTVPAAPTMPAARSETSPTPHPKSRTCIPSPMPARRNTSAVRSS